MILANAIPDPVAEFKNVKIEELYGRSNLTSIENLG